MGGMQPLERRRRRMVVGGALVELRFARVKDLGVGVAYGLILFSASDSNRRVLTCPPGSALGVDRALIGRNGERLSVQPDGDTVVMPPAINHAGNARSWRAPASSNRLTPMRFVHTCVRVRDPEASMRFYEALGFERRGRLNFETAYNIYMGLPGDGDTLELTVNRGREEPYDIGDGYNHMALVVDDLDALLHKLSAQGIEPERPPYSPGGRPEIGRICFVQDPDGYRIELIDREFPTPQDPDD
jgi:lactoylglutathione lyase